MQQCADLIRALAFTSDSSKMLSFTQEPSCPGLSCRELDWLQEQSPEKNAHKIQRLMRRIATVITAHLFLLATRFVPEYLF